LKLQTQKSFAQHVVSQQPIYVLAIVNYEEFGYDMREEFIQRIARERFNGWKSREVFTQLTDNNKPHDMAEAYAIQAELYKIMRTEDLFTDFGGHKVALTSPAIQEMCGVDEPAYGAIFKEFIHQSPYAIKAADFMRVGVEFEVAFEVAEDIPISQTPYDKDSIVDFICAAMPAFELIEDRCADYSKLDAVSILTDRCWCNGIVLGERITDWKNLDLGNAKSKVSLNGVINDEGNTRDALGHPLIGVAWIANHLNKNGSSLKAGDVIMTGSALKTQFINPGDKVTYCIDGLGEVAANVI